MNLSGLIRRLLGGPERTAASMEGPPELAFEEMRLMWRKRWLSALQYYADIDTQKRRWLDLTEQNPYYSYVECMCGYFDDTFFQGHEIHDWVSLGYMTEAEYAAMLPFHRLAEAYKAPNGNDYARDAILIDPRWMEVVQAAQVAQASLVQMVTDEGELAALQTPPQWTRKDGRFYLAGGGSIITPLAG